MEFMAGYILYISFLTMNPLHLAFDVRYTNRSFDYRAEFWKIKSGYQFFRYPIWRGNVNKYADVFGRMISL